MNLCQLISESGGSRDFCTLTIVSFVLEVIISFMQRYVLVLMWYIRGNRFWSAGFDNGLSTWWWNEIQGKCIINFYSRNKSLLIVPNSWHVTLGWSFDWPLNINSNGLYSFFSRLGFSNVVENISRNHQPFNTVFFDKKKYQMSSFKSFDKIHGHFYLFRLTFGSVKTMVKTTHSKFKLLRLRSNW